MNSFKAMDAYFLHPDVQEAKDNQSDLQELDKKIDDKEAHLVSSLW
jgi:hypothetical protein